MTKTFELNTIKGNEKLLLLALADFSNDDGVCFPSYKTLEAKTSMNRGSVSKWLTSLEDRGLLLRAKRKRKNGSNSSNKYLLFPGELFNKLDEEDKEFFDQSLENVLPDHSLENELPTVEQSLEVELVGSLEVELPYEPSLLNAPLSNLTITKKEEMFDSFWEVYPRKEGKKKAKEAFLNPKNFKRMPCMNAIIGAVILQSMTKQWEDGFIPHATTWINGHRWEDEVQLSDTDKIKAIAEHEGKSFSEVRDLWIKGELDGI